MARKRPKLSLELEGLDGLVKSLAQFKSKTIAKRIMRGAMNKAGTVLLQAARKNAPKESGTLKKALTRTVLSKGFNMTTIIGADATKSGQGPDGRTRLPSNYVHLAEYGFQHVSGKHVPGSRFLEKARVEQGPKVSEKFTAEVGAGIEKELAKGNKRRRK
jgi:HK97 gp10 family phage protein